MFYREYLVMRKAVAWFAAVLFAVMLLGLLTRVIDLNNPDLSGIDVDAAWLTAIFASIFGVALGNGSREAARVFWVLPAQRWKLALQVIAGDLAGATVAYACAYGVLLLILIAGGLHLTGQMAGTISASRIVMGLAMVYATYGWSALAGMLGRRVPYCGIFALPALMLWMIFAQSQATFSAVLRAPIVANPFVVFNAALAPGSVTASLKWLGAASGTPTLIAIAVVTCALAVTLWQRAEAIY